MTSKFLLYSIIHVITTRDSCVCVMSLVCDIPQTKDQIDSSVTVRVSSASVIKQSSFFTINTIVPILSMLASHVFTEALQKLPSVSCTGSSLDQGSNVQPTELAWYELVSKYLNWHLFMHHLTFLDNSAIFNRA